jgi:hypothetical protein
MYINIIILPFLAALISGFFGRALGVKGVHIINISCILLTTILSMIAFYEVILCNSPVSIELLPWINSEHMRIMWSFYFDELTVSMLIPVLIVSLLVHLYSVGYMGEDPHQQRFFSYISLFTGLMIILVTGNNFLVLFLGWEGVGICSYLLVHFWYTRIAAVKSAMNAMFTNRIGDYFLTIGFFALFFTFGTLDFASIFTLVPYINVNIITLISLLLLLGAAAKSAQLGLHIWLPMAMEGFLNRAFLKLHYMREHPVLSLGPLKFSLFGKIQDEGQSAGHSNRSSSETTCEVFKLKDDKFKLWFIGFVEGDGSFIINKDGYLEFKITQSSKDAQILFMIKKELGFGVVRVQDFVRNTHCYRVRDKNNILKLISIFNGNIFLDSRKEQFKLWLNAFNLKYKENILYLDIEFKPSFKNGWLSGFTDAEGCFTCSLYDNKLNNTKLVKLSYILSQNGNSDNMDHLASILGGKKQILKNYNGYNVTVNTNKLSPIIQYFSFYPLRTKKYIIYFNWIKIYKLVIDKKHKDPEGLSLILRYKNNINKSEYNESFNINEDIVRSVK